jgi:hypothetical protein
MLTRRDKPVVFARNSDGGDPGLPLRRTISLREMTRERKRRERAGLPIVTEAPDVERPKTRADCKDGPRPCPWVSCKHHLYLDVSANGSLKTYRPDEDPSGLIASCALDVAERGGVNLDEVGELMNLTKERVRQIESAALAKLRDTDLGPFRDFEAGGGDAPADDANIDRVRAPSTMSLVCGWEDA